MIELPLRFEYTEMDKGIIGILNIISKTCVKPKIADGACHREERSDVAISTKDSYFGDCHAPKGRSQ